MDNYVVNVITFLFASVFTSLFLINFRSLIPFKYSVSHLNLQRLRLIILSVFLTSKVLYSILLSWKSNVFEESRIYERQYRIPILPTYQIYDTNVKIENLFYFSRNS